MRIIALAAGLGLAVALALAPARAQTAASVTAPASGGGALPLPIPAPNLAVPTAVPCTPQQCSGLYLRGGITGLGSNVDLIGQGLSGSVFAGGSILDIGVGYQLWNGQYFAAVEASIGYQAVNGSSAAGFNSSSIVGFEQIKLGGALSGLLGQGQAGTTTAGQAPAAITLPANLQSALIAPYYGIGMMQRGGTNVFATGPGVELAIASSTSLDLQYLYEPAAGGLPAANMVRLGLQWHFAP